MVQKHSLMYFMERFPDDLSCRKYLEERFWNNVPVCPHCKSSEKIYRYKDGIKFKCACCKKQFKVTTGTIYENSNIPLRKWFITFFLLSLSKKGISSIELSKTIGVTQKSAWYLLHKVRYMLEHKESNNQLQGVVELDETYVGGKKKGKRGRGSENKTCVFGSIQRKGRLKITPVPNAKRKTLAPIIQQYVRAGTHIMTDEWFAYRELHYRYNHEFVQHHTKEYVRGNVHTNTLEGAWSHLKRSIMGTYHRPSRQHLSKYCAEFEFNYNTRRKSPFSKFNQAIDKNKIQIKYSNIVEL